MSDYEYEVRQLICEAHEMNAVIVRQTSELASLRAALDAAQDEIERLISEKEALRAERDDIWHRFDLTWAHARPRVTVMTTMQNPASAPGGAA